MSRLIKKFSDDSFLEYDTGKFDEWCVYLTRPNQPKYAPTDTEYFNFFINLGKKFGYANVYKDFVSIYKLTNSRIDPAVLILIEKISQKYSNVKLECTIWFTVIYAGMVAEENKQNAILKKRIKRLAMHQILIDRLSADVAANYSYGKKWRELDREMKEKGF